MRKAHIWFAMVVALGMLSGAVAGNAARQQAAPKTKAAPAAKKPAAKSDSGTVAWPNKPEDLSGKLSEVDTRDSTFTVIANNTPYSFRYTKTTKIQIDGKNSNLDALIFEAGHNATVHFMAKRNGNIAASVDVTS